MKRGKVISLKQFLARRKRQVPTDAGEPAPPDDGLNQRSLNFWSASFEKLNEYLKALQQRRPR